MNPLQGTRRNTYKGGIGCWGHAERVHHESVRSGVLGGMGKFPLGLVPTEKVLSGSVLARFTRDSEQHERCGYRVAWSISLVGKQRCLKG